MSRAAHRTVIGVVVVLLILMVVLLYRGPRFTADGTTAYSSTGQAADIPDLHVRCGSVLTAGWPGDGAVVNDGPHTWSSFDVKPSVSMPGDVADYVYAGLDQECNERRDSYLAFLIILAVPTCLLGALAISRPPRPTRVPGEAQP